MMRKTLFTTIVLLFGLSTFAQTLTVTKEFTLVPNSSVLAMYKNQFGKWEKADLDDTFPYAVIRMRLEGNAREVTMAKQRLTLYLGTQTAVLDRYAQNSNELLFLVPARRPTIYIDCGDGCDKVLLMENQQLQSNRVYDGVVHFVPEEGEQIQYQEAVDREQMKKEILLELMDSIQRENTEVKEVPQEDSLTIIPNKYNTYAQNAKIKTLVMGQIGYSVAPQLSYGAMIGQMYKGYGWYLKGRSNFHFAPSTSLVCDANGSIDGEKLFFSGNTSATHYAVSGGFMMNFIEQKAKNKFNTFGCYIGGGYGKREIQWETADGKWVTYAPTSYKGFAGDFGVLGSVYGVTLNVGLSTINFRYLELEVGIGFMF